MSLDKPFHVVTTINWLIQHEQYIGQDRWAPYNNIPTIFP